MNSAWSIEFSRIVLVLVSTLVFGLVSGYWLLSVAVNGGLYVGWNAYQLRRFERWIRSGAHTASAPDASGVWELIVQHIYRTQKANKDRKKRLAQLASHYHAIMSVLPDATVVLNQNLEVEWVNKISQSMLGIDANRDVGQKFSNIVRVTDITRLIESAPDAEEIEVVSPADINKMLVIKKIHYGEGKILVTARDISQRIALQKLRKAFIANASHELRTPLTVISGYLEMLVDDEELPPNLNNIVQNTYLQAQRMDNILGDLLVLSKLEEKGYSETSGDILDVPQLIKRLVNDFQKTKARSTHRIEFDVTEGLKVKVVESEFYSLCQNLISNAIKYSPPGSSIRIAWVLSDTAGACLKVTDNGVGIKPEHLSRLTERFYRVDQNTTRKVNGTGLGLSIVKHIIENYGGYLNIESEIDKGSTFTTCFPSFRVSYHQDASDKV
ncbi:MAG: phosphate regulon sensor histidine kinase PhoR [Enterobacterales bacterium]|nr:phosphate regulon sensor histidine kinase PhoR [Enterobacterales bacterium]